MSEIENKKKKKIGIHLKREQWFIIVITVVVILCIAIGLFITNSNKKKEANNGTPSDQTDQNVQNEPTTGEDTNGLIDLNNKDNVEVKDNTKTNNSQALLKDRTFNGMNVKDIALVAQNGITNFTAVIENTTGKDFPDSNIVIVFKNKDGSEFERLESRIGSIKNGGNAAINAGVTSDLSNAYDFSIELAK